MDSLSLIHVFLESLPQAILQAGAIVVKNVVNNDRQCLFSKFSLEHWIDYREYGERSAYRCALHCAVLYIALCTALCIAFTCNNELYDHSTAQSRTVLQNLFL